MGATDDQIRTDLYAVLTTLDASSNIGVVHEYERWALHLSDILTLLRDPTDNAVRSWMIAYKGFTAKHHEYEDDYISGKALSIRTHRFLIRGVRSLDDSEETEKTFQAVAQAVCEALDKKENLHNQDRYWGKTPPCSLDIFELRAFAGTLCHVAEISVEVTAFHAIT